MNQTMGTTIAQLFYSLGVIPVIEIDLADLAVPLAELLCEAGLPVLDVTRRTG